MRVDTIRQDQESNRTIAPAANLDEPQPSFHAQDRVTEAPFRGHENVCINSNEHSAEFTVLMFG